MKEQIQSQFMQLQDQICAHLEALDGVGKFRQDLWERPKGGGGRTRIITGQHIEKGGVNFSAVHGPMPQKISDKLGLPENKFFATGVSIVLHPINPHVPIIHMNVRYFETDAGMWWFGGGIDLTPHFVDPELAKDFHSRLKAVCDKHGAHYFKDFKKWADDYFYVKHRKETRGIGGIFFDRLDSSKGKQSEHFDFVMDVGRSFIPIYTHQFNEGFNKAYSDREKKWQLYRRGRYVEFNLVWDRGTKFGLDTDGNIESILMSLPPQVEWTYRYEMNEKEQHTIDLLKKGIDWVSVFGL